MILVRGHIRPTDPRKIRANRESAFSDGRRIARARDLYALSNRMIAGAAIKLSVTWRMDFSLRIFLMYLRHNKPRLSPRVRTTSLSPRFKQHRGSDRFADFRVAHAGRAQSDEGGALALSRGRDAHMPLERIC
jgi:hypothetical protein